MKLRGVYLAVRILFRPKSARGWPVSSLASSGNGILKNIRLAVLSCSFSSDTPLSPFAEPLAESLFFSAEPFLAWKRSSILPRFLCSLFPVTRWVAQRFRLIGLVIRLAWVWLTAFIAAAMTDVRRKGKQVRCRQCNALIQRRTRREGFKMACRNSAWISSVGNVFAMRAGWCRWCRVSLCCGLMEGLTTNLVLVKRCVERTNKCGQQTSRPPKSNRVTGYG